MSDLELTMMRRVGELNKEVSALKAEVERLTALNEKIMATADIIDANNQRLTKAGDELHAFLINYIVESRISSSYLNKLDDDWNAAKEGNAK